LVTVSKDATKDVKIEHTGTYTTYTLPLKTGGNIRTFELDVREATGTKHSETIYGGSLTNDEIREDKRSFRYQLRELDPTGKVIHNSISAEVSFDRDTPQGTVDRGLTKILMENIEVQIKTENTTIVEDFKEFFSESKLGRYIQGRREKKKKDRHDQRNDLRPKI
jgi:hypothetical protein